MGKLHRSIGLLHGGEGQGIPLIQYVHDFQVRSLLMTARLLLLDQGKPLWECSIGVYVVSSQPHQHYHRKTHVAGESELMEEADGL